MPQIISLIGYRGTGKSTVGMRLARRLKWQWIDADNEIERRAGRSIKEIFATDGEPTFRQLEREVIVELLGRHQIVISTGGGAILNPETRNDLQNAGPVVWLAATVETIAARILGDSTTASRRPKLTAKGGIDEIRELLALREPFYEQCASIKIQTDGLSLSEVVTAIMQQLPADQFEEIR
jgi:shikimate kinase